MIPIQQAFRDSKKQACYCTPSEEAKGWLLRFRTVRHGILNQSVFHRMSCQGFVAVDHLVWKSCFEVLDVIEAACPDVDC